MSQEEKRETTADERGEVKIARDFDFPRELIFDMFTDAKKAVKWWAPKEFTKLAFEFDARPGGAIRIDDRSPEGVVNRTTGTAIDVVVPELLSFRTSTKGGDLPRPWEALAVVTFEELGPKRTRVTVTNRILAAGSWEGDVGSLVGGFKGGWTESLESLQGELHHRAHAASSTS